MVSFWAHSNGAVDVLDDANDIKEDSTNLTEHNRLKKNDEKKRVCCSKVLIVKCKMLLICNICSARII